MEEKFIVSAWYNMVRISKLKNDKKVNLSCFCGVYQGLHLFITFLCVKYFQIYMQMKAFSFSYHYITVNP